MDRSTPQPDNELCLVSTDGLSKGDLDRLPETVLKRALSEVVEPGKDPDPDAGFDNRLG